MGPYMAIPLAVDSDHQVIVELGVSNQPPNVERPKPMLERIATRDGALAEVMTFDAGYCNEDNAKTCADQGIDAYIAIGRLPHGQPLALKHGTLPKDADARTRMARSSALKRGPGSTCSARQSSNRRTDRSWSHAACAASCCAAQRMSMASNTVDRRHAQPGQVIQIQAITAADRWQQPQDKGQKTWT